MLNGGTDLDLDPDPDPSVLVLQLRGGGRAAAATLYPLSIGPSETDKLLVETRNTLNK